MVEGAVVILHLTTATVGVVMSTPRAWVRFLWTTAVVVFTAASLKLEAHSGDRGNQSQKKNEHP
jgi:hypothetical protein